jgi:hypothetical protein
MSKKAVKQVLDLLRMMPHVVELMEQRAAKILRPFKESIVGAEIR